MVPLVPRPAASAPSGGSVILIMTRTATPAVRDMLAGAGRAAVQP
jgi:hypothetical protein